MNLEVTTSHEELVRKSVLLLGIPAYSPEDAPYPMYLRVLMAWQVRTPASPLRDVLDDLIAKYPTQTQASVELLPVGATEFTPPELIDPPLKELPLTKGQARAWAKIQKFVAHPDEYGFFVLRGYSGTGKTYLIQKLLAEITSHTLLLSATTNKAAKVMTAMLGRKAKTIYSVLGIRMAPEEDQTVLQYPDELPQGLRGAVIVVDEASMIGRQLLDFIVRAAKALGLKIIFVGDPAQLRPVGESYSPVWSLVKDKSRRALLTEVKRYDDQLLVLATAIRQALKERTYDVDIRDFVDNKRVFKLGASFERRILKAGAGARVACWRNRAVDYYNDLIRAHLGFAAPYCPGDVLLAAAPVVIDGNIVANIDEEFTVKIVQTATITHRSVPIEVRRLIVDYDDQSLVLAIPTKVGRRTLDDLLGIIAEEAKALSGYRRKTRWQEFYQLKEKFHKVRYGFAMTTHRLQGSTLPELFVDLHDILANKEIREAYQCFYVAQTRVSDKVYFT